MATGRGSGAAAAAHARAASLFGDPAQAAAYASCRPTYPPALLRALASYAAAGLGRPARTVLDVATGTGQAALIAAATLPGVAITALDASAAQVGAAAAALAGASPPITLLHAPAEDTGLPPASFDLVLIAQALHWLTVPAAFYAEAARVLAPGGAVGVLSYGWPTVKEKAAGGDGDGGAGRTLPASTAALRSAVNDPPLGPLWDAGRALLDAGLPGLDPPPGLFEGVERWEGEHFMRTAAGAGGVGGYVRSWSAHAAWRKGGGGGPDPAATVEAAVRGEVGEGGEVAMEWPVLVLVGRARKEGLGSGLFSVFGAAARRA